MVCHPPLPPLDFPQPSGVGVALPVADARVVSSRDVLRLGVSLPTLLGHRRRHGGAAKHTLALPPSASTSWGARVRWELAIVQVPLLLPPPLPVLPLGASRRRSL